jgi:siroheme synthase
VGKQPYGEYTPQETIHALIKEKALAKGRVVRLKGGDPYIFGRGFEEILFARENGIDAHYIPGITSMQAVGLEDIPLTHRNVGCDRHKKGWLPVERSKACNKKQSHGSRLYGHEKAERDSQCL